ncbi:cation-efflux pump [Nibricoccus aquaticus]|uniref:Cation-efflux pump n=1 Tax=Nibricoccus aquaticus TaxID=2576891 RepID=A0A290QFG7_9BACT|nr:cation diffusion facilitator family transporter [Nibricoccus aquaticus]ATC64078.1 cation-efflux pump [Nibricoccus aquaticus]
MRGIALNATLAAVKIAGGVIGNTYALIADGVESLVDIFSSALVWAGLRVAVRPPDDNHPYGHGKAESLAGLAVALFMLFAAGWIGWHSVHEIRTPHHAPHWGTLPLLAGIIGVKYAFSRKLVEVGREAGSTSLGIEAWHHLADALTSAAAFIGIAIAVWGGAGYESADDWAALAACLVIAINGVTLARRALDDVMDVAVPREFETQIRATAAAVPGVRGLEKCRIRKSGLQHIVDIHVEVDGRLSVHEGHRIAGAVKHALLASPHRVSDVLVHIEPAAE